MEYNDDGQLIKTVKNNETTTYKYDDRGNRISQTTNNKTTTYTFDKYNNLLKITNPDGYFFEYEYDGLNNRISLRFPYKDYITPKTAIDNNDIDYLYDDHNTLLNNDSFNSSINNTDLLIKGSIDNINNLLSDNTYTPYYSSNKIEVIRYKKLYYLNDYTTNSDTYIAIKIDNKYRYTTIGNNNNTISSNNKLLLSDYQGSIVLSLSKDNLYTINTYGYSDYGVSNIDNNPLDSKSISISYTNQDISLNKLIYLTERVFKAILNN